MAHTKETQTNWPWKPSQTGRENPAKPTLGYLHGFALRRNPTKPAETPEPHPHPIGPHCNLGWQPLPLSLGMTALLPQASAFLLFFWGASWDLNPGWLVPLLTDEPPHYYCVCMGSSWLIASCNNHCSEPHIVGAHIYFHLRLHNAYIENVFHCSVHFTQ